MVQNRNQGDGDLAVAPRGELLASSTSGSIQVWSGSDGRLLCELEAMEPSALVFSPDGRRLAARVEPGPSAGGQVTGKPARSRGGQDERRRTGTSRGSRGATLAIWDLTQCGTRHDLTDDIYRNTDIAPLSDGRLLVRDRRQSIHLTDPFGTTTPKSLPLPHALQRIEAHAGLGSVVAGYGPDRRLGLIDLATGQAEPLADGMGTAGLSQADGRPMVALSPNGRWMVWQSADSSRFTVFDRLSRQAVASSPVYPDGPPAALMRGSAGLSAEMLVKARAAAHRAQWLGITPDEQRMLVVVRDADPMNGSLRQVLQVRSLPALRLLHSLPMASVNSPDSHFGGFALSADGSRLAVRTKADIGVVRLDDGAPTLSLWPTMAGQITTIRFTERGDLVILNGARPTDGLARQADAAPGAPGQGYLMHWPLRTGTPQVRTLSQGGDFTALSGDGRRLAHVEPAAGRPGIGQVVMVDARSFQPLWRGPVLQGMDRVAWLALDHDGSRLAIRHMASGRLDLFDTVTGRSIGQVAGLPATALFIRFSADGRAVLAGDPTSIRVVVPLEGPDRLRPITLPFGNWLGSLPGMPGALVASAQGAQLSAGMAAAMNNERVQATRQRMQEALEAANARSRESMKNMPALQGSSTLAQEILGTGVPPMPSPAGSFDKLPVLYVNTRGNLAHADTRGEQLATAGHFAGAPVEIHTLTAGKATGQRFVLEGASGSGVTAMAFSPDGQWLAVAGRDGAATLWDLGSRRWLARLYAFADGTWVTVDPQGRFDTNRLERVRHLHWVMPDEPLRAWPLEIFMRQYYEPRLLPRLLAGEKLPPVRPVGQLNRAQPKVRIAKVMPDTDGRLSVDVEVEAQRDTQGRDGGVHDLRLFRNGQLVARQPAGAGALKVDAATGIAHARFRAISVPTGTAPVEWSAYAFNVDGVKSETAYATWQPPASSRARRGRVFVLSIGVNTHENPDWNLQFAVNDARRMMQTLTERARQTGRYSEVIGVALTAERPGDRLATRAQIEAALRRLAGQTVDPQTLAGVPDADKLAAATPDDLVLVSYSGHGHAGEAGRFHLLPSDTGTGRGREVTPALLARSVSSDDLAQWMADLDAGAIGMVIDACYSAAAVQADGFKPGPMGARGLGQLAYDKGMRILAASQADDVAIESSRLRHGLLTHALLSDGMDAGHADHEPADRQIDLAEWLGYGMQRVPQLHQEIVAGRQDSGRGATLRIDPQVSRKLEQRIHAQQPYLFDFTEDRRRPLLAQVPGR